MTRLKRTVYIHVEDNALYGLCVAEVVGLKNPVMHLALVEEVEKRLAYRPDMTLSLHTPMPDWARGKVVLRQSA